MKILLLGISHHSACVGLRELASVPREEKGSASAALVDSGACAEAAVLSTCNRTELFLAAADPEPAERAAERFFVERCGSGQGDALLAALYRKRDAEAVRHLFEVVTSLDSLVIGEPHIVGQVREDFEAAQEAGAAGKVIGRLFHRALELGKSVRRHTAIGESPVSVSSIALDLALRVFGTLQGRSVLVLGAGEMGRQTAILARHRGAGRILVASRTLERSRELADRVQGELCPWDRHGEAIAEVDVVISSTGSPAPIIDRRQMERVMQGRRNRPVFLIDIAVPRDVSPEVDAIDNLYRYDLDDLTGIARENERRRGDAIPEVRRRIEEACADFERWRSEQKVVPAIVGLRDHVEGIRQAEVEAHLKKMHSIDERDRNLVEALSRAIVNKILHPPTIRLKEAAAHGTELRHARSLNYLFDLEDAEDGEDSGPDQ